MKQILVLQGGWVLVGSVTVSADVYQVKNGSVIRRWGTSKGLGELAEKGPLENTILDKIPYTEVERRNVLMLISANGFD